MNVNYKLAPSFLLVIDEFVVTVLIELPFLYVADLVKGRQSNLQQTGTLAKGRPGDPGRRMLEIKASPIPFCFFLTLFLPVLGCGTLGKRDIC